MQIRTAVSLSPRHAYAVITEPNRKTGQSADQLFDTMMAYSARYRFQSDDCFVTTVDSAWLPAWIGTEQVRYFKINGDELLVTGLFRENPKYPGRRIRGVGQRE